MGTDPTRGLSPSDALEIRGPIGPVTTGASYSGLPFRLRGKTD